MHWIDVWKIGEGQKKIAKFFFQVPIFSIQNVKIHSGGQAKVGTAKDLKTFFTWSHAKHKHLGLCCQSHRQYFMGRGKNWLSKFQQILEANVQ